MNADYADEDRGGEYIYYVERKTGKSGGRMFWKGYQKSCWQRENEVGVKEKRVTDGNLYSGSVIRF
jgi:hypothetical protein